MTAKRGRCDRIFAQFYHNIPKLVTAKRGRCDRNCTTVVVTSLPKLVTAKRGRCDVERIVRPALEPQAGDRQARSL